MLIVLLLAGSVGIVSDLTPELIRQAVADTKTESCHLVGVAFTSGAFGCFTTPYSRVVGAAQEAKKRYKGFTEADVTAELISAGEVHVYALAKQIGRSASIANVEAVVLVPPGSKDPMQPVRTLDVPAQYKNAMGATLEGKSVTAVFPVSAFVEGAELRVVWDRLPERKWKVKLNDVR